MASILYGNGWQGVRGRADDIRSQLLLRRGRALPGSRLQVRARCARSAVSAPEDPTQPASWLDRVEFRFVAVKASGLINVLFVLATICWLSARARALFKALRIAVLLMMPFCWVAFHTEHLYPREGYFFWIPGMMLVLFSKRLGRPSEPAALASAAF
jgi:hypothetical protein